MLSIEERRAVRRTFARQVRQEHARREVVTISPPLPEGRATLVQHPPLRVAIATPVLYVGGAEQWIASLCQWLAPARALVTKAITLRRRWGTIAEETPYRTYISEPKRKRKGHRKEAHRGKRKPPTQRKAVLANRRRMKGARGKRLQRLRSDKVERTFAHRLETGGARRTWLRGIDKVRKRYSLAAAAHNPGVLMCALFGMGTPRSLQQF